MLSMSGTFLPTMYYINGVMVIIIGFEWFLFFLFFLEFCFYSFYSFIFKSALELWSNATIEIIYYYKYYYYLFIVLQQILGCSILKAILNEFSFINRSSDIGLSWEFHTRCKHTFEVLPSCILSIYHYYCRYHITPPSSFPSSSLP